MNELISSKVIIYLDMKRCTISYLISSSSDAHYPSIVLQNPDLVPVPANNHSLIEEPCVSFSSPRSTRLLSPVI